MKKMKKLLAFILALTMIMGMATTAFAAPVSDEKFEKHTFTAYKIFAADSITETKELKNLVWGNGITEAGQAALLTKYNVTTAPALAKKLADGTIDAKAFATEAYKYKTNGAAVESGETFLDLGYYLIEDTTEKLATEGDAYNLSILKVSDNTNAVVVTNKTDVPSVDKEILDPTAMKNNEAAIGEVVKYEITGTLPSNLDDYKTYFYQFTDTLSRGLTYVADNPDTEVNEGLKVTIDDVDVTSYFYKNVTADNSTGGTIITVAIKDIKALNRINGISVTKDSNVVITYSATINENAVIAGDGNDNKVTLEYSNKPDESGTPDNDPPTPPNNNPPTKPDATGKTPESKVVTYVTELTIIKTDENNKTLTGAEFTLTGKNIHSIKLTTGDRYVEDEDGTYYKLVDGTYTTEAPKSPVKDEETGEVTDEGNLELYVAPVNGKYTMYKNETFVETTGAPEDDKSVAAFVDAEGKITFTGLGAGNYTIEETVVPAGYNKAENIVFTINYANGKFSSTNTAVKVSTEKPNTLETTVINRSGAVLPETGGMGTKLFYIFGAAMVLFAGVLLVAKRRMNRA